MSWDYRIVERQGMFTIHEVHYNEKGEITSVSEDPMGPSGETPEDLKEDMQYFLQALEKPALKKDDLPVFKVEEECR